MPMVSAVLSPNHTVGLRCHGERLLPCADDEVAARRNAAVVRDKRDCFWFQWPSAAAACRSDTHTRAHTHRHTNTHTHTHTDVHVLQIKHLNQVCVGLQTDRNIAAGCVRKPSWVFRAAMLRRTSHAGHTGFSLRHLPASAAIAAIMS